MNVVLVTTAALALWVAHSALLTFPADRKFSGWTTYQRKRINWALWYAFHAANRMLATKRFGGEREPFTLYQGSGSRSVGASAGTHAGTGAADTSAWNWKNRVWVFRLLGFAAWMRPRIKGLWVQHIHMIMCGDGGAARLALQQVVSFWKRPSRDGLKGNRVDTQLPKMLCRPLFVYPVKAVGRPGRFRCKVTCGAYEQQTTKAKRLDTVNAGETWEIVAVTRDRDTRDYWGVTADGKCIYLDNFERAA